MMQIEGFHKASGAWIDLAFVPDDEIKGTQQIIAVVFEGALTTVVFSGCAVVVSDFSAFRLNDKAH